nr:hypothetical protein [Tanacetum cinerariifolium]
MILLPSRTAMLSLFMFIYMPYTIARAICMHDYDMFSPSHGGSSGLQRFFRYAMFIYSFYLCYVLSLYPFTERYAQPYFFSCLIRQRGVTGDEEVKEQGKEEDEMETDVKVKEVIEEEESEFKTVEEVEEILKEEEEDEDDEKFNLFLTMKECSHHEWLLKNPQPPIIGHCLGDMVFGRPFIDETSLVYDKEDGTVMFKQDNEKIKFKMPHTMEIFKQTRLMDASIDSTPPLAYEENFSNGRTNYYQTLLIGDEYRQDEGDRRGLRHLMRLEKAMMEDEGEVTVWILLTVSNALVIFDEKKLGSS